MTLEQLRIFLAVAEREHVTEAARALNLTQSAVSNAVAALEERHAVALFDRVGRGIVLNANGRVFVEEARAVLRRAGAAETVLADLSGLRRGRLAILASQTVAGYWLPERLVRWSARHPAIALDMQVANTREVAAGVLDGRAELGLVEGEIEHPALEAEAVGQDRLLLVAGRRHPWAARRRLRADELVAAPWVMREPGSGTRSSLEAALAALGCDPAHLRIAMTLPSNEAVLAAAMAGAGITALSEHVARHAIEAGRMSVLPLGLQQRRFQLLRHRERHLTRAAESFCAMLRAEARA